MTTTHDHESGFTLIEVMIALGILAVGLLGLYSVHNYTLELNKVSAQVTEATMLADEGLEDLLSKSYGPLGTNPLLGVFGADPSAPGSPASMLVPLPFSIDGGATINRYGSTNPSYAPIDYLRSYSVEAAPNSNGDRVLIKMRVTFLDKRGRIHGVTLAATRSWDGDTRS